MYKLKILPGFTPTDSFDILKKYKIKNVYVGFFDENSENKWPVAFNTINRRGEGASFYGIKEFEVFAKKAQKNNINVYVTFNVYYSKKQLNWILKSIQKISKLQPVKGIIVTDINLLLLLKKTKYNKEIIISTLANIFNSYAIEFYASLGSNRFVLDRQQTAKEILDIIRKYPQYQYEIFFLMGDGCFFIDGYCSSMHTQEISTTKRYNTSIKTTLCMKILEQNKLKDKKFQNKMLPYKCNICLLYYLKDFDNVNLKIPNRTITNSTGSKIMDDILELDNYLSSNNVSFKQFHTFCRKFLKKNKNISCNKNICLCRDLF